MPRFDRVPFFQRTYDIIQRSQRTYPAAEYSAEHNGHEHNNQREEKCRRYFCCTGSKKSCNKNKRIKIEEELDRITECIIPFRFCLDEEKQEKEQENTLRDYSQIFIGYATYLNTDILYFQFREIHCADTYCCSGFHV